MFNMSAAMAAEFAAAAQQMTERVMKLRPSPLRGTQRAPIGAEQENRT
jgi:coenzyme F420-reducing hydrogenase delta subunit